MASALALQCSTNWAMKIHTLVNLLSSSQRLKGMKHNEDDVNCGRGGTQWFRFYFSLSFPFLFLTFGFSLRHLAFWLRYDRRSGNCNLSDRILAHDSTGFEPVLVEVSKFSLSGLICNCLIYNYRCDDHIFIWNCISTVHIIFIL